jgi:UDP-GlcNAc:undecaprenyl-phosphate GlcNAc-1-phosphate transferase
MHKTHSHPIPYLGGFAIVIPIAIGALLSPHLLHLNYVSHVEYLGFLLAPIFLSIIGAIDDKFILPPLPRFIVQVSSSLVLLVFFASENWFGNPLRNSSLNYLVSLLWLVGITNSLNFFDNLDGGAAGFSVISSFTIFMMAALSGQDAVALISIALCGSCLGFLFWNRNPARIYLGDAGALFVGMLLAIILIRFDPISAIRAGSLLTPVFIMMVPILDTSVAVLSRLRRGISPFQGGKDHLSHRLQQKGIGKRNSALILWSLTAFFCILALLIQTSSKSYINFFIFFGVLSSFVLFVWFSRQPHQL